MSTAAPPWRAAVPSGVVTCRVTSGYSSGRCSASRARPPTLANTCRADGKLGAASSSASGTAAVSAAAPSDSDDASVDNTHIAVQDIVTRLDYLTEQSRFLCVILGIYLVFTLIYQADILKWKERQNAHSNGPWDLVEHTHRFWE